MKLFCWISIPGDCHCESAVGENRQDWRVDQGVSTGLIGNDFGADKGTFFELLDIETPERLM